MTETRRGAIALAGDDPLNHRTLTSSSLKGTTQNLAESSDTTSLGQRYSQVLDAKAAARHLHLSLNTLYGLSRRGEIPGRKCGAQWRYSLAMLDRYVEGDPS
jgi:hypothetical protein